MDKGIGVLIPDTTPPANIGDLCRQVEAWDYGEIWVSEDYFFNAGISSAALALQATNIIPVGIGILSAVVRHPAVTAMELATLAGAFPGRLRAGIGHGVPAWTSQMGLTPENRLATLREVITSIRRLLAGELLDQTDGLFQFNGVKLTQPVENVSLYAGVIGPQSLALSGEIADGTVLSIMAGAKYLAYARDNINRGMEKAGRSGTHPLPTYTLYLVDNDRQRARGAGRQALSMLMSAFGSSQLTGVYGINDQLEDMITRGGPEVIANEMPDEWLDWFMVVGEPEECADGISRLHRAGASSVVLMPLAIEDIMAQLRLTSDKVLPCLS